MPSPYIILKHPSGDGLGDGDGDGPGDGGTVVDPELSSVLVESLASPDVVSVAVGLGDGLGLGLGETDGEGEGDGKG